MPIVLTGFCEKKNKKILEQIMKIQYKQVVNTWTEPDISFWSTSGAYHVSTVNTSRTFPEAKLKFQKSTAKIWDGTMCFPPCQEGTRQSTT